MFATRRRTEPPPAPPGVALDVVDVDLRDRRAVVAAWQAVRPDVVVHAAYRKDAAGVVEATRNVAGATDGVGAALVHVSSDVVFGGDPRSTYGEDAPLDPVSDYGRWKAEAEQVVGMLVPGAAVVRTSLLVRRDPPDHGSRLVLELASGAASGALFDDELRQPALASDVARFLWSLLALPHDRRAGAWHAVGPDVRSRLELGRVVARWHGVDPDRLPSRPSAGLDLDRPRVLRLATDRAEREGLPLPGPVTRAR